MKLALLFVSLPLLAFAADVPVYVIETLRPRQTIRHFGASDCWSMWQIGKWDATRQAQVADWLFSKELDANGQPKGIGLSLWRFNLGAGSAEQGDASQIDRWTRTECLLASDGTWNWERQRAERNFLRLAKARGVPHFLAFCNSAPVQFTQNGLATNTGRNDTMNLRGDCYDDFADYIARAIKGVEEHDGVRFDYVSPVNEPDGHWNWLGPKQEGSPAHDSEVARLARELDKSLTAQGLQTKILVNEASDYRCLVGVHMTDVWRGFHFQRFFGSPGSDTDVKGLSHILPVLGGHSYWSNTPVPFMREMRLKVRDEARRFGVGFWQTEYCIMGNDEEIGGGGGYDFTMKTALYVARLIHHDLCFAEAESWSWWRAAGGDYKDGLLRVYAQKGLEDGWAVDSKILWTFGNFSRFVRPGAVRHEMTVRNADGTIREEGWNDPFGVMCSAYRNANGRWVVVALNYSQEQQSFRLCLGESPSVWRGYRTSDREGESLKPVGLFKDKVVLPPRSATTLIAVRQ